jgi:hypothetical protein
LGAGGAATGRGGGKGVSGGGVGAGIENFRKTGVARNLFYIRPSGSKSLTGLGKNSRGGWAAACGQL